MLSEMPHNSHPVHNIIIYIASSPSFLVIMLSSRQANNSLIVDFPSSPRLRTSGGTSQVSSKSVHFSSHVDGRYINYPTDEEVIKQWYSDDDYSGFKEKMIQDTLKWSSKLFHGNRKTGDLVRYVGLENFISRDVSERYKAVKKGRNDHARSVLEEQKRLRRCNDNSPESIALVAMSSSHSNRKRARNVATLVQSIV